MTRLLLISGLVGCMIASCKLSQRTSPSLIPYLPSAHVDLDGKIEEACWDNAFTIDTLYDLEDRSNQDDRTQIFIFYEEENLFLGAILRNQNIKAEMTTRDTILYKEHCIEFFFDPSQDGLDYYELEINPLGTVWDLKLKTSNHSLDGNVMEWHIPQQNFAVFVEGSLNDATDRDDYWSVEVKIPWAHFSEAKPVTGEQWKINVMRMDYIADKAHYLVWKNTKPGNIHLPEKWGRVTFN